MSGTEYHSGVAQKIEFHPGYTLEEKVKKLIKKGFAFDFMDIENKDISCEDLIYIPSKDDFYVLVHHHQAEPEEYFAYADENGNGTINFNLQFYNGGASFEEVFEEAISNMTKFKG